MNYDNWKLSNPYDDYNNGYFMVSKCCGSKEYEEDVRMCGECGSFDIEEKFVGDEGWSICGGCEVVEGSEEYVVVCGMCQEECSLIEDYEYSSKAKDDYDDMMED